VPFTGGCMEKCNSILPCGHFCTRYCHPSDSEHQTFKCQILLQKYCDNEEEKHIVRRRCCEKKWPQCRKLVIKVRLVASLLLRVASPNLISFLNCFLYFFTKSQLCRFWYSGVANPKIGGGKMFDFRQITLFCLEKCLSKHKISVFSENLGGMAPLLPTWLRLCSDKKNSNVVDKNKIFPFA